MKMYLKLFVDLKQCAIIFSEALSSKNKRGMVMTVIIPFVVIILIALNFKLLLKQPHGAQTMIEISRRIRRNAGTFIAHKYRLVFICAVFIVIVLRVLTAWYVAVAFLAGVFMSSLAGYTGMKVAIRGNMCVSEAAKTHKELGPALKIVLLGGFVMGLSVGSLALLEMIRVMSLFSYQLKPEDFEIVHNYSQINFIPLVMTLSSYALGCSIVAMFDRVGGGIYTKAVTMATDLVGKTELRISENDPRNPVTIANNMGNNVGDVRV